MEAQYFPPLLEVWALGSNGGHIYLGEGSHAVRLLSPCVASILTPCPVFLPTCYRVPLPPWLPSGGHLHEHKCVHILRSPSTQLSPNLLTTSFSILFSQRPWLVGQLIDPCADHSGYIHIFNHLSSTWKPDVPPEVLSWGKISYALSFRNGPECSRHPLPGSSGDHAINPWVKLVLLPPSLTGHMESPWGHSAGWQRGETDTLRRHLGGWNHLLLQVNYVAYTCLDQISMYRFHFIMECFCAHSVVLHGGLVDQTSSSRWAVQLTLCLCLVVSLSSSTRSGKKGAACAMEKVLGRGRQCLTPAPSGSVLWTLFGASQRLHTASPCCRHFQYHWVKRPQSQSPGQCSLQSQLSWRLSLLQTLLETGTIRVDRVTLWAIWLEKHFQTWFVLPPQSKETYKDCASFFVVISTRAVTCLSLQRRYPDHRSPRTFLDVPGSWIFPGLSLPCGTLVRTKACWVPR